jgi:hypothetical protein
MNRFNGPCICGCGGDRACHDCNEYSAHIRHEGLVYQFFGDDKGIYHRHIALCPDHEMTLDYTEVVAN